MKAPFNELSKNVLDELITDVFSESKGRTHAFFYYSYLICFYIIFFFFRFLNSCRISFAVLLKVVLEIDNYGKTPVFDCSGSRIIQKPMYLLTQATSWRSKIPLTNETNECDNCDWGQG